jgi:hypothetical protein
MNEKQIDTLLQMAQRLEDAAASLETAANRVLEQQIALAAKAQEPMCEPVGETIVATIDPMAEEMRMAELERRLQEAEQQLAAFSASASMEPGRKTVAAGAARMIGKPDGEGVSLAAASVDAALAGLSLEQRIAVKAGLLRSGFIG